MVRVCLVVLALAFGGPVVAQSESIRAVIGAQLKALEADDFAKAFSYASPTIKGMFRTPERFGAMVREGYPMVWRPSGVRFGPLREIDGRQVQTVYLTDAQGRDFEATYEMIEGASGWQINGVAIAEADLSV